MDLCRAASGNLSPYGAASPGQLECATPTGAAGWPEVAPIVGIGGRSFAPPSDTSSSPSCSSSGGAPNRGSKGSLVGSGVSAGSAARAESAANDGTDDSFDLDVDPEWTERIAQMDQTDLGSLQGPSSRRLEDAGGPRHHFLERIEEASNEGSQSQSILGLGRVTSINEVSDWSSPASWAATSGLRGLAPSAGPSLT